MTTFFPCPEVPPLGPFPSISPLSAASRRPTEPRILPTRKGLGTAVARSGRDDIVAFLSNRRLWFIEGVEDSDR